MIRALIKSFKNVTISEKFLYPHATVGPMLKRFEFTDMVTNAQKSEDSKFNELKRYRQAEVCIE